MQQTPKECLVSDGHRSRCWGDVKELKVTRSWELTFQWRKFPVFILTDVATMLSNYQHPQPTPGVGALRQADGFLGLCSLQDLQGQGWGRPCAVRMCHGETGTEGSTGGGGVEKEGEKWFTGSLRRSLLDHTTRGPTGGREEQSKIEPSSQVLPLQEVEMEQSALGGTTG